MGQILRQKKRISYLSGGLMVLASFNIHLSPIEAKGAPVTTISQTTNKDELYTLIEQIAVEAKGRVGVAATVLESGESVTFNGDQRFVMKAFISFL